MPSKSHRRGKKPHDQAAPPTKRPTFNSENSTGGGIGNGLDSSRDSASEHVEISESASELAARLHWFISSYIEALSAFDDLGDLPPLCMELSKIDPSRKDQLGASRENALAALRACVGVCRDLARDNPSFNRDLAGMLQILSKYSLDAGLQEESVAALQEYAAVCRKSGDAGVYSPDLADALEKLHTHLLKLGRQTEALAVARDRVDLCRLAPQTESRYNNDLAKALNELGGHLLDLGWQEHALAALRESVEIYRDPHNMDFDFLRIFRFLDADNCLHIAEAFERLHICLLELGRHADALAVARERVEFYRHAPGERLRNKFFKALKDLSGHLLDIGRQEDGLAALRESEVVYRDRHHLQGHISSNSPSFSDELGHLRGPPLLQGDQKDAPIDERWMRVRSPAGEWLREKKKLSEALENAFGHLSNLGGQGGAQTLMQEVVLRPPRSPGGDRTTTVHTTWPANSTPLSLTLHDRGASTEVHRICTKQCYQFPAEVLSSIHKCGHDLSDPIQLLCHLQFHILEDPLRFPLHDIRTYFMVFYKTHRISLSPSMNSPYCPSTALLDLLQSCLVDCSIHMEYLWMRQEQKTLLLRMLQDVCSVTNKLPSCYNLLGPLHEGKPFTGGGEFLIFHGTWQSMHHVAIRKPRCPRGGWDTDAGREVLQSLRGEIISHWQLRHQNVLSLLGICYEEEVPTMVVPFMENGSAYAYLKQVDFGDKTRFLTVIHDAALGLQYLHVQRPPVIHGDLHDENILVDRSGRALICDFGLSRIRHETIRTYTCIRTGGQELFIPPEMSGEDDEEPRTSEAGDIYTFAMAILKLGTGEKPFKGEYKNDRIAARKAQDGHRPRKPSALGGLPDASMDSLWFLMEMMWAHDPTKRPPAATVVGVMQQLIPARPPKSRSNA